MCVCVCIYNIVCILYPDRLVHPIFPTLEEEEVLFIYSFPLIYWFSKGGRKKLWIGFTWTVGVNRR